jgi:predicted homoserine dehydrogenase-like protein
MFRMAIALSVIAAAKTLPNRPKSDQTPHTTEGRISQRRKAKTRSVVCFLR